MIIPKSRTFIAALALICAGALLPDTALAAEEGNPWGIWHLVGRFFNLFLVVAVLIWVGRKPLANFFAGRTQAIRDQLAEAQRARVEAEAKLAEIQSRMSGLDDEIREIKAAADREAREEYERLLAAAEQDSQRIIERSRQEIEAITRAAQQELKLQVAELSVKLAEEKVRREITDVDQGRIFSQFVTRLGGDR